MKHSLTVAEMRHQMQHVKGQVCQLVVYRTASPRYSSEHDLLSGIGAAKAGGRWNPKGTAAVYCSFTPEAALAETLAVQRYYGWPLHGALPRVIVAIEVLLANVLDLTDGAVRQKLHISESRMVETDWRAEVASGVEPLTQKIGQAAFETRFQGIKVMSATSEKGPNLVVFPKNLDDDRRLTVLK